jgi:hypothetical protein
MLPRNLQQEALSLAYVHVIAAGAGLIFTQPAYDVGIDVCLQTVVARGQRHGPGGVQLDLQVKSTTRPNIRDGQLFYDLEVKNYDDLRLPSPMCPRLLVVVVLPADEATWLAESPEGLTLRPRAYWRWLGDAEATTATTTIRVAIPMANVFSVSALQQIINRLERGEQPC